ncbi:MAG TPA: HAMP domain-containing sensor histidine kinase [Chitinophagaceae bacterium]|nr:HAMP domain-containing sensor histidine kinase [Chitinophagaceae bacterium]
MPVRIRVTIYFAVIGFVILSLVCTGVYYFSYANREKNFNIRLTNRAVTTAHFLVQTETFNNDLIQKIDAATAVSMTDKTTQAYDLEDRCIYAYSDQPGDTIPVTKDILDEAKLKTYVYFSAGNRDALAYHHVDKNNRVVIITAAYDADGKRNLGQLKFILWICFVGGIMVTVAGGYFFSSGLLRPIRNIADELNEISAQSLTTRLPTSSNKDEWNYLTRTLNELLDRLEESFHIQARFIANASHELSTPLTSVSSQLEVSLQKERSAEEYRRIMQSVLHDVRHLSKLTQTLLAFAKASGNAGGLEINLVRIDEILLRMPGEMTKINKGYTVKLDFDNLPEEDEKLLVLGNEDLLLSAIRNIVLNACKYSADHTAMLKLSVKGDVISVEIADKGKGIPPEAIQNIFQPFYRVDDNQSEAGFGLGLSLASRIIKLQRGKILVNSAVNTGTTFTIQLPVAGTK